MKDLVSTRWIGVVRLAAPMSVVWLVFILQGFPWAGLACVLGLAFSAALWEGTSSTRSITQVIGDVEAEPVQAVRVAPPVPKAGVY